MTVSCSGGLPLANSSQIYVSPLATATIYVASPAARPLGAVVRMAIPVGDSQGNLPGAPCLRTITAGRAFRFSARYAPLISPRQDGLAMSRFLTRAFLPALLFFTLSPVGVATAADRRTADIHLGCRCRP